MFILPVKQITSRSRVERQGLQTFLLNLLGVLSKPRLDEVFFVSFPSFKGLKNNIWYN